jgi:hypothetical protein
MDSEDEFMSGLSSEEDGTLQDESDNEEGSVDGRCLYSVLPVVVTSHSFIRARLTFTSP